MNNTFKLVATYLREQEISYSKASATKEEDGKKEQETKTSFSGNMIGNADKKNFKEEDADPIELAKGLDVEREHTADPTIAKKIALDHLSEKGLEKYYTNLINMEKAIKEKRKSIDLVF
jgi:hypothetical protein